MTAPSLEPGSTFESNGYCYRIQRSVEVGDGREAQQRAMEEVRLATYLHHPNIANVYGCAAFEGQPYVVLEHQRGCFLLTLMDAAMQVNDMLSPAFAAYVAAQVAEALEYAHRCLDDKGRPLRIVHRAVGPLRIRLGAGGRVKLTNFGAAWSELMGRLRTPPGLLRGDVAYLAPEILRNVREPEPGQADPLTPRGLDGRADIFSLGLVLLEMLVAHYPLDPPEELWSDIPRRFPEGIRAEQLPFLRVETLADRVLHFGPEQVRRACETVPEPLRRIVSRALSQEPDERYPTAGELGAELRQYLGTLGRAYGAAQLDDEVGRVLKGAADYRTLDAHGSVERGVLPLPSDMKTVD
ncbi:serine/threonine-protein kinase [Archangium sp.]|uniref:serine/threonine-protein kinase n=1 Tax=Archangium sp. TaxID=1872627 RepID=UPI00286C4A3C|nr:serine/threonine-protein kinase [Archangium sp.]